MKLRGASAISMFLFAGLMAHALQYVAMAIFVGIGVWLTYGDTH